MKLEYNILWIEDDKNWIRVPKKKIERAITDFGFIPNIRIVNDCNLDDINLYECDMIFVDYNLDTCTPRQYGNIILESLQSKNIYTDAIFYSSSNIDDLYYKVKDSNLLNISVLPRDVFNPENINQVINIIKYFLKKDLDLNTMRGIMLSEVAKFDNRIWNIIEKIKNQSEIIEYIKQKKNEQKDVFDKYTESQLWKILTDIETSTIHFSSGMRGTYLKKSLDVLSKKDDKYNSLYEIAKTYYDEIIIIRNSLAHREMVTSDDEENFIQIRKNIIKHKENIENISNIIETDV